MSGSSSLGLRGASRGYTLALRACRRVGKAAAALAGGPTVPSCMGDRPTLGE